MAYDLTTRVQEFSSQLSAHATQIREALPAHLSDANFRAAVLNCFRTDAKLQACSEGSIIESVLAAAACGLAPINGHAYLIPYNQRCTFVPGWKGLAHLVVESGKAMVSTNVALAGDHFRPLLGTINQIEHAPLAPEEEAAWLEQHAPMKVRTITHAYAVGRLRGFETTPIVECWPLLKLRRHRDKYNKQGAKHYSFREEEQYFRKVVLLQVIKLLPQSQQMANALAAGIAAETGAPLVVEGGVVQVEGGAEYWDDEDGASDTGGEPEAPAPRPQPRAKNAASAPAARATTAAERADPVTGELHDEPPPARAALLRPGPVEAISAGKRIGPSGLAWLNFAIGKGQLDRAEVLRRHGVARLEDLPHESMMTMRRELAAQAG
jgi:recombination protein RecT